MMKTSPRAPFEVVEAELFFQLLVGLLAGPTSLDRADELAELSLGRMIGEIEFSFAARSFFTDQPGLRAW